jgi:hypothetical protein
MWPLAKSKLRKVYVRKFMMIELLVAVVWWPVLIAGVILGLIIGHMLIETLLDWVWGKQPGGRRGYHR